MKRSQLSGAQKRKHVEENKRKIAETISKTKKLTSFFRPDQSEPPPSVDIPIPGTSKNSEENFTIQEPSDSESLNNTEDRKDKIVINRAPNQENDPGLWREVSNVDEQNWLSCGPNDCQNHISSFEKSRRTYGSTSRYCHEKVFIGQKPNGENYKREWLLYLPSTGSLYCFICKLFGSDKSSVFDISTGFSDWRNTKVMIEGQEKSSSHRDCLLTYLTRRKGLSLHQGFDKQVHEENVYWKHVSQRVIAVIRTLAERGLLFRGAVEKFGSPQNGNFGALLELISQFHPFSAAHITKYGKTGKGNVSYLSKTIYEELIMIMAQEVHGKIISQIKDTRY
ncbi:zinc finger MYM-type protein 5-like [Diorhabda carinulata]|uniref:zinc finger MYM-type protein 5-like n=1 Tax=Diorhabda carinulata TaxID=1163345 RepID=UPI0025A00966|nr:zinc finger MYM-type protein 5-like [Diorhabda carinulata]